MRIATNYKLLLRLAVFSALLVPIGCGDDDDRAPVDASELDTFVPDVPVLPDVPLVDGEVPDSGVMCEPGLVDCGEGCTALAGDSNHCGACGNACASGVSCAVGRCDCEEPQKSCDGLCTDPATDNDNCGMCGNACREGDICLEGACVIDCEAPDQRCPSGEDEFICSDPQTDSMNCGVCGAACSAGAECVDGTCSCGEGQISCSGACVDTMNDANFCGNCITSCGDEGVCTDGACSTCGTGLTACGDVARCTDTDTSRLHCGACDNTCEAGAECVDGVCGCLPGFVDCDGECAALASDRNNCGACGVDCGPGGECSAGSCVCAPDATACGDECAVLTNDPNNCGACGDACESGQICRESACLELNDTCATATPVTADISIADEDIELGGDRPMGTGCGGGTGATALYYEVTVPAGQRALVDTDSSADLVVFSLSACGESTCTDSSDFPEALTIDNATGTDPVTEYVGVRGYSSSTTGTYDLSVTYTTPVIADNASCSTATVVTEDVTITGEDLEQGGARPSGTGCGFGSGPLALYYAVTVPAGQRVTANVPTRTSDLVLFIQDACDDDGCTDSADFPERLVIDNAEAFDATYYLGVRGYSSDTGTFDIDFAYTTPVFATNDNDTCATATAVSEDVVIIGADTVEGGARPMGAECGFGTGATALYYEVTVPPGQRARLVFDGPDLVVFSQNACADTDCIESSDTPEEITVDNLMGAAPLVQYVGVRGYSATTTGLTDVSVTYTTPVVPTNTTCATATEVTADVTLSNQLTEFGGARSTATGCGGGSGEESLYYSVTVPAGDQVVVQTSPSGDIVLYELASCGAATCVTSTDSSPERLTFNNSTADAATHIFGVRPYGSFSGTPSFGISFTYSTP
ncbi:MAG: hypothetical protein AB8H86_01620 [Polyangiales bacterium]